LLPLGEPSPRIVPPTSDVPFVARRHPQPAPSGESSSHAPLSRSRPTTPTISRPPTHPNESLRSRQMLRPRRLSTTSPERTCSPGPHLRHRGEAMTQPRPRTPSTVSTDRELAPTTHAALNSELKTRTTRSPFHRRIWPRAASGGYPRSPTTSAQVTHNALRRCTTHTRDACDRFLPSCCFKLEHPCLVRSRRGRCLAPADVFRFRVRHPSRFLGGASVRAPSGFTPPK